MGIAVGDIYTTKTDPCSLAKNAASFVLTKFIDVNPTKKVHILHIFKLHLEG